jgi:hypothetical protein
MPTWKNFLLETADENGLGAEIAAEVETGAYEAAAQRLLEELGAHAFHRRIEAVFGDHAIREAAFDEAAVTIVPALARGPVVTLNYDRVLERAFARARRPS